MAKIKALRNKHSQSKHSRKTKANAEPTSSASDISQFVKAHLEHETEPPDEEISLDEHHGPEYVRARQQAEDEAVIDELLASVPRNQGYYLVLYKELSPNQFEIKERIDHFHHWSDLEWEITDLVRKRTQKYPARWGSGRYRIVIKRDGGMRGERYDPVDFLIDAGEPESLAPPQPPPTTVDPMEMTETQLSALEKLLGAIRSVVPPPPNPADLQQHLAQAFTQGMNMKVNESSQQGQMFAAMMTAMMTMMKDIMMAAKSQESPKEDPAQSLARTITIMKDLGVLPTAQPKSDSLKDTIIELKTLGLDPFKSTDPMQQVQQVRAIASLLQDFMGGNTAERPSIAEKLVDALAPSLPEIIANIKGLSDNYTRIQTAKALGGPGGPSRPALNPSEVSQAPMAPASTPSPQEPIGVISGAKGPPTNGTASPPPSPPPSPQTAPEQDDMSQQFFHTLAEHIRQQNTAYFPELTQVIASAMGGEDFLQAILSGAISIEQIRLVLIQWGGSTFADPNMKPLLESYMSKYQQWLRQQAQESHTPMLIGECSSCHTEYEYDTEETYQQEKICDAEINGVPCKGEIFLKSPSSTS